MQAGGRRFDPDHLQVASLFLGVASPFGVASTKQDAAKASVGNGRGISEFGRCAGMTAVGRGSGRAGRVVVFFDV